MTIIRKRAEGDPRLRPLKQPLYDTAYLAHNTATGRLSFFQTPQGQLITAGGNPKTEADTNLKQSSQLGKPNMFEIYGFQMDVTLDTAGASDAENVIANMKLIYETGLFQFYFSTQMPWVRVPAYQIPSGLHQIGAVATADAGVPTDYAFLGNGIASTREMYDFTVNKIPVTVDYAESFNATLTWPGADITITTSDTNGYRICTYIKGIYYKGM